MAVLVALLTSAASVPLALAAPSAVLTPKPLPAGASPPPAGLVQAPPKWALSCHTTAGEFPQIVFKNIGTQSIGPTIGITVNFATAKSIGLNLPKAVAPGESVNVPLTDDNNGKSRGACTVKIFGQP